ncbi:hypothetical protein GOBAR_AA18627 [Gossypium barbadense]|uniref:Aminotransferase-like plant mobile domain-containing protein n=1 Tax=Gossypium barbadense TaxID=3634 RepID=A0A2P5XFB0_GOSBA|nr:hypothetical protein GOBAR_AA18627 [Gossypium barbadense]
MLYSDPRIQACISSEFLVNPKIWHVKVTLVVYPMMEMHESDRALQQFEFRYDFIPNREPIIARELAYGPEYMSWFKRHGKPYLLSEEARGRQRHMRRLRQASKNPRSGEATKEGSSSTPMQEEASMVALPLGEPSSQPAPQPFVRRIKETRWKPKSTSQSTTDESKVEKGREPQHVPEGEGDDEGEEDEQSEPQLKQRRNLSSN